MAKLGTIGGISGLSSTVDRVAESQRNIATLQNLDNAIQKDKQERMMFQELEQQQYDEISKKADELLQPDRARINKKAIEMQARVKSKIKEYGGRKAFFDAGGVSIINEYKNNILQSDEAGIYRDNQNNMKQILAAQLAGKGGLLSTTDMQNLTNYQNGTGQIITYSGLKSEIDIPTAVHDYGEDIPALNILHNADNYMKIYGNFIKDNPALKGLIGKDLEEQLIEYTYQNYGKSRGSNQFKMQQEASEKEYLRRRADAVRDGSTSQKVASEKPLNPNDTVEVPWIESMNSYMGTAGQELEMTPQNIIGNNYIKNLGAKNNFASALFGDKGNYYNVAAQQLSRGGINTLDNVGIALGNFVGYSDTYKPASAVKVLPYSKPNLDKKIFGSGDGKGNYTLSETENYIMPNGMPMDYTNKHDYIRGKSWKVENYIIGFKDESGKMLTDIMDSSGNSLKASNEKDRERVREHRTGYSSSAKHEMYAVLKNSDGETIYKPIGISNPQIATDIAGAVGKGNDVGKQFKISNRNDQAINAVKQQDMLRDDLVQNEVNKASTVNGAFGQNAFIEEAKQMQTGDNNNRNRLLKAYYMTLSHLNTGVGADANDMVNNGFINQRHFSKIVNQFAQLKNASIAKKSYSDNTFIDMFAKITSQDDMEHEAENAQFAELWKQYLNILNKK